MPGPNSSDWALLRDVPPGLGRSVFLRDVPLVWDGLGRSGMVWAHIGVVFRDSRERTMAVEGLLSPVASHRGSRK